MQKKNPEKGLIGLPRWPKRSWHRKAEEPLGQKHQA